MIERLEDLISWVDVQLVPVVVRDQDSTPSGQRLAEKCVQELLFILEGVLLTGNVESRVYMIELQGVSKKSSFNGLNSVFGF